MDSLRKSFTEHVSCSTIAVFVFFLILFVIGLASFKDYGVCWDEISQRRVGEACYDYVIHANDAYLTSADRHYGPVFEFVIIAIGKKLGLTDIRSRLHFRYLSIFTLFYVSVLVFYHIAHQRFENRGLALLCCLFLVSHPRIFAHSFFNTRDIAVLALFIISSYTLIRLLRHPSSTNAVFHALASAVLIDIRIVGLIVPGLTFLFIGIECWRNHGAAEFRGANLSRTLVCYSVLLIGLVIIGRPMLWSHPLGNLIDTFKLMSKYVWSGRVLFNGQHHIAYNLPWHYIPSWIVITTPILYTGAFLAGLVSTAGLPFSGKLSRNGLYDLYFAMWAIIPVCAVIGLNSTLYDGWRHLFFIYPGFILVAVKGIQVTAGSMAAMGGRRCYLGLALIGAAISLTLADTISFMIRNHPHQYVYFNRLAGRDMASIKDRFELDYWGLSYKQALDYVAATDQRDPVLFFPRNDPGEYNLAALPKDARARIRRTPSIEDAHYYMTNFRNHPPGIKDYEQQLGKPCFSVNVGNATIMAVYKLK